MAIRYPIRTHEGSEENLAHTWEMHMADDYRTEVLERFVLSSPTPTQIVNTKLIPTDAPARQGLLDYHPRTGASYSVTTVIEGSGADSYLRIVPHLATGSAWSAEQQDLLRQLKFIPMPEVPFGGRTPVLQMMRSGKGNIRLANRPWYLFYARIEKTEIDGKLLNDVTLLWEYVDPQHQTTFLRPVASCWKW